MDRIEEIRARCEAYEKELANGAPASTGVFRARLDLDYWAWSDLKYLLTEVERLAADNAAQAARIAELEREKDAQLDALRKRLHGLSYESSDWSHGCHPRVVELDEIDDLFDEWCGMEEASDD